MNQLDPIEELYDMYLEEEDTPRIVELKDNDLDFVSDINGPAVINRLDPIEEVYNMYSEEEDTSRILKVGGDDLDFVSDIEGLANPYMDL